MNIKGHLLPGSIAAVFHAALFTLIPAGDHGDNGPTVIEVPILPPWPAKQVDPTPPPEPPDPSSEPVRALPGGPTLPGLDEPTPSAKADFVIPAVERIKGPEVALNKIPEGGGPGGPGFGDIGARTPGIIGARDLDGGPRARLQLPPDYPPAMRNSGVGGSVFVEFDVDTSGRVTRAVAVHYTEREFVEPALKAVRKWRFEPGRRGGMVVPFRMSVPIVFGLEDR